MGELVLHCKCSTNSKELRDTAKGPEKKENVLLPGLPLWHFRLNQLNYHCGCVNFMDYLVGGIASRE